jgi:hypothetical protein
MRVLIYQSQGTDDIAIACRSVEEAINCFRADAEVMLHDTNGDGEGYDVHLSQAEMTEEQFANMQEV